MVVSASLFSPSIVCTLHRTLHRTRCPFSRRSIVCAMRSPNTPFSTKLTLYYTYGVIQCIYICVYVLRRPRDQAANAVFIRSNYRFPLSCVRRVVCATGSVVLHKSQIPFLIVECLESALYATTYTYTGAHTKTFSARKGSSQQKQ